MIGSGDIFVMLAVSGTIVPVASHVCFDTSLSVSDVRITSLAFGIFSEVQQLHVVFTKLKGVGFPMTVLDSVKLSQDMSFMPAPLFPAGELFAVLLWAHVALLAFVCVRGTRRILLNDKSSNVHSGIDSISFLFAILSKVDSYFRMMASRSDTACLFRASVFRIACDLVKGGNGLSILSCVSFGCHASDPLLDSFTSLSDLSFPLNSSSSSGLVGVASETGVVKLLVLDRLD